MKNIKRKQMPPIPPFCSVLTSGAFTKNQFIYFAGNSGIHAIVLASMDMKFDMDMKT